MANTFKLNIDPDFFFGKDFSKKGIQPATVLELFKVFDDRLTALENGGTSGGTSEEWSEALSISENHSAITINGLYLFELYWFDSELDVKFEWFILLNIDRDLCAAGGDDMIIINDRVDNILIPQIGSLEPMPTHFKYKKIG